MAHEGDLGRCDKLRGTAVLQREQMLDGPPYLEGLVLLESEFLQVRLGRGAAGTGGEVEVASGGVAVPAAVQDEEGVPLAGEVPGHLGRTGDRSGARAVDEHQQGQAGLAGGDRLSTGQ